MRARRHGPHDPQAVLQLGFGFDFLFSTLD